MDVHHRASLHGCLYQGISAPLLRRSIADNPSRAQPCKRYGMMVFQFAEQTLKHRAFGTNSQAMDRMPFCTHVPITTSIHSSMRIQGPAPHRYASPGSMIFAAPARRFLFQPQLALTTSSSCRVGVDSKATLP